MLTGILFLWSLDKLSALSGVLCSRLAGFSTAGSGQQESEGWLPKTGGLLGGPGPSACRCSCVCDSKRIG